MKHEITEKPEISKTSKKKKKKKKKPRKRKKKEEKKKGLHLGSIQNLEFGIWKRRMANHVHFFDF
jgi:hypothetical protein